MDKETQERIDKLSSLVIEIGAERDKLLGQLRDKDKWSPRVKPEPMASDRSRDRSLDKNTSNNNDALKEALTSGILEFITFFARYLLFN